MSSQDSSLTSRAITTSSEELTEFRPPTSDKAEYSASVGATRERLQRRQRSPNFFVQSLLSITVATFAFLVVAVIVLAIVVPPWYRGLEPRYQAAWCNRAPVLCELRPTAPQEDILALEGRDASEADRLLLVTAMPSPTATVTLTPTMAATHSGNAAVETPTPQLTATWTPTPTATPIPYPAQASLRTDQLRWELQGWNNCGPTTMTIALSYFGYQRNQQRAASFMKPYPEDKNVSPNQMVSYVNTVAAQELPVRAIYRVGGNTDMLRKFIHADFPVIVERGIYYEGEWMGHYSLLVGYDDLAGNYYVYDSFFGYGKNEGGKGRAYPQYEIEDGWKQFNYTFVVLYDPARENTVRDILGTHADPLLAAQSALETARSQVTRDPDDKWAWFNLGSSYTYLGDYDNAALAYDRARTLALPFRMLWYQFGPYRAYFHTGHYNDVLALALANERTTPYVEEIYFYRGLVYAAQGKTDSAIFQFDRALRFNEGFTAAAEAKQQVLEGRFDKNNW